MLYYTQVIFVKPGQEAVFEQFEAHVLPLLEQYRGELLLRWRQTADGVIHSSMGAPYEVHLVTFPTVDDFKAYAQDRTRQSFLHLKDSSVEKVLLIEGRQL
jgi:hypothetical protein